MSSPVTSAPVFQQAGDDETIDLLGMLHSVWARKWAILGLALVVAIAAGFWMGSNPAIYEAKSTLLIEQTQANVVSIKDIYEPGYQGTEYMQTQFELLRSRSIAERVVRKLQLQNLEQYKPRPPRPKAWYEFNLSSLKPAGSNPQPAKPWVMPSEEEQIQALTSMVAGSIQVKQNGDSNVVTLTFSSGDPKLAVSIVNAYLEQYIESFMASKLESTRKAQSWLTDRMADLKLNLQNAENRLQAFREQEKLVDLKGVTTLSEQEVTNLAAIYSQSRQRRLELENTQKELERVGGKGRSIDDVLTIPDIQNRDSVKRMIQAEMDSQRNVGELSRRYGPKHPKLLEAKSQLASARAALEKEVGNVVSSIQKEYQLALKSETSTKTQLEAAKQDVQEINSKDFRLKELQQDVDTNTQLYNLFFTRIKETGDGGLFEAPPARILDLSQGADKVGPNIQQAVMVAFGLTFVLACGLAILLDMLDNTIKTPIDVEEKLGVPVLGTLPIMKKSAEGGLQEYWQDSKSEFSEAIRTIRTGVVLSGLDKPAKLIVVTSSVPGEGKSTLALNLAASFSQMEKTLVIGADLRRPSLARKCNLPAKHPGLSNYVAGSATLEECISQFGESQLSVMPAGIIPSNPLEMLSSHKFRETLELLKTRFDRIVIDSAPVAAVSDALMLASYADALIFVVKADDTAATLARKSIAQLENANELLTGVVLNHFDPSKSVKYYGNYNYRYGGNYYNSSDTHG